MQNISKLEMNGNDYNDHSKLAEAKFLRKKADEDARLLANRIALLKQEEQKAVRKIEETQKKTEEIIEARTRAFKAEQKIQGLKRLKEEQNHAKIEQIRVERERMKAMWQQANKFKTEQAMMEIKSLKVAKKNNIKTIQLKKFEDLNEKMGKKNRVKEQSKDAEYKKRKILEDRLERVKLDNLKKMEAENNVRKAKEEYLARLEQEELELIQRLQNTQLMQRNAYEDLESALSGNQQ